jgi:hypothetical protein
VVYREFIGREQKQMFFESVQAIPGGGISPGGAALLLGVTRQRIGVLVYHTDYVRAWIYRDRPGHQACYLEISVRDLLRYGVLMGRFKVGDTLPYIGVLTAEELEAVDDVTPVR